MKVSLKIDKNALIDSILLTAEYRDRISQYQVYTDYEKNTIHIIELKGGQLSFVEIAHFIQQEIVDSLDSTNKIVECWTWLVYDYNDGSFVKSYYKGKIMLVSANNPNVNQRYITYTLRNA